MNYVNQRQRKAYKRRVVKDSYALGVSKTSRLYALHRSTIYEWRMLIEEKKSGPNKRVSWQTPAHLERIVARLRKQTNYGPKRLKYELDLHGITLGEKAIRGIVERRKLVKKHRKKRKKIPQVFFAPYAGYRIQVDTKVVPDNLPDKRSGKRYQYTAIDCYTKIRFLWIYEDLSIVNVLDFLQNMITFYESIGIEIETVQTDNHNTFTNLYVGGNKKEDHEHIKIHPVTQFLLDRHIQHLLSRPGTPTDNTFVERSHRTDNEEFYRTINLQSLSMKQLQETLQKWVHFYNFLRPHSSCGTIPPMKYYLSVGKTGA
jgi:transposase InsO family protein